jgi:hypothetical protein
VWQQVAAFIAGAGGVGHLAVVRAKVVMAEAAVLEAVSMRVVVERTEANVGICHGLVAAIGYSDLQFPCQTAGSSFSVDDLISSPLPIVVARYFFMLLLPSPSFLPLPSPSGTFRSRSLYVPLLSSFFCTLLPCSG